MSMQSKLQVPHEGGKMDADCVSVPLSQSLTESPGNRGLWLHISAKMHPMDQMSTGVE